jgi:hypothetical protein
MLNEEHVFIFPVRTTSPFIMQVIENVKMDVKKNLFNRDNCKDLVKDVINDLIPKIED